MTFESRGIVFFQFPSRYVTNRTNPSKPLVPQPPGRTTVAGIIYNKGLVTMGGNTRLLPDFFNGLDTVQYAFT